MSRLDRPIITETKFLDRIIELANTLRFNKLKIRTAEENIFH